MFKARDLACRMQFYRGVRGSGRVQLVLSKFNEFGGTCGVGLGGQSRKGVGYAPSTAARPLVKSVCQQEAGG